MKMKSLNSISTFAFAECSMNEFDAPNLNSISVEKGVYG